MSIFRDSISDRHCLYPFNSNCPVVKQWGWIIAAVMNVLAWNWMRWESERERAWSWGRGGLFRLVLALSFSHLCPPPRPFFNFLIRFIQNQSKAKQSTVDQTGKEQSIFKIHGLTDIYSKTVRSLLVLSILLYIYRCSPPPPNAETETDLLTKFCLYLSTQKWDWGFVVNSLTSSLLQSIIFCHWFTWVFWYIYWSRTHISITVSFTVAA